MVTGVIHEDALQYIVQITIFLVIVSNAKLVVVHGDSKCWLIFKQWNIFSWYIWLLFPLNRFLEVLGLHYRYCWYCLFVFFSFLLIAFVLLLIGKPLILSWTIYFMAGNKSPKSFTSSYMWKHARTFFKRVFKKQNLLHSEKICST